jgi:hypothetical protein
MKYGIVLNWHCQQSPGCRRLLGVANVEKSPLTLVKRGKVIINNESTYYTFFLSVNKGTTLTIPRYLYRV